MLAGIINEFLPGLPGLVGPRQQQPALRHVPADKDDIVKVINEEGVQLGVGCAGYDSTEAREQIGSRDKKPLVHYDYLYLD